MTDDSLGQEGRRMWVGWPAIIGWLGILVFTFYAGTHMVAAGDTWVAMACGRHFVNHGVDTVEPFSANSHKAGPTAEEVKKWPGWAQWITGKVGLETVRYWHPTGWVNQNWLTHVIFYKLTTALGSETEPYYNALVWWKFAIYILAAVALYYTARLYGVHPALAAILICFAMIIGRSFLDIRPAGFSNLLVAVFILVLALASYRNAQYIWLIVPLVVFWSNVHGGYIYAFIVLIPFVGWHAIMNLPRRWMVASYGILTWLVLYGMTYQFLHHEYLKAVSLSKDWAFYLLVVAIAGGVALTCRRSIGIASVIAYYVSVSCVLFLLFLPRFFPAIPLVGLTRLERADLKEFIALSRLSYIGIFSLALVLGAVVVLLKDKVVRTMNVRGILHVLAAYVVAFVAMVLFNPFHLSNLTHTLEISVSKHAERWRNVHEWNRAFDWANPVGTAAPFLVMYILAWLVLIVWVGALIYSSRVVDRPLKKRAKTTSDFAWPKIDLGLVIIAAMTVYMAIRSRRFIPIAGFAACPVIALLIDQAVRAVAAMIQFSRTGKFETPLIPALWQRTLLITGAVIVAAFALVWGVRFKRVYLDPWPPDPVYASVFMRMTASYSKPFAACEFMRMNKLSGKMFNYWTEGGAIAWGQEPDPKTGKIPLQLFMDGRAQAAYDVATFDLYLGIMSGGPTVEAAALAGRKMTVSDYTKAGDWIGQRLRKHGVWVVLMPDLAFDSPFTYALEYSSDWRIVYMDEKQKLFVDVRSPKGAQLYQGMSTGQTLYPNEYLANLALGHNLLLFVDMNEKKRGLELLIKAFNDSLSPAPMTDMYLIGSQLEELQPRIDEVCRQYVQTFANNKKTYARQDGYNYRIEAARIALIRLQNSAVAGNDAQLAQGYSDQIERYRAERDKLQVTNRW